MLITSVQTLSTVLLYVGTALFLALGLDPLVSFLERRGFHRWAALLITFAGVLAVFAGIVLMVVPIIVSQVTQVITQVQKLVEAAINQEWDPVVAAKDWLHEIFPLLKVDEVFDWIVDWYATLDLGKIGQSVGEGVVGLGAGIIAATTGAIIVLILT
ncbi:MAG: AI-2E family transporter, partial [Microbacterium sp.]